MTPGPDEQNRARGLMSVFLSENAFILRARVCFVKFFMKRFLPAALIALLIALIVLLIVYMLYAMHGGPSLRIQLEREEQQIRDIRFYGAVKQAFALLIPGGLLLSGVIVSIGFARRKSVFMARIGKHSEFPVHYSHIRSGALAQQLTALVTAEELKQSNAGLETAMALYATIAETQLKILRAAPRSALPAAAPAIIDAPATAAPSFADLLHSGAFRSGQILLGYDAAAAPVYLRLTDFVSASVGGGSGSGKTSKLRFLCAQLIAQGVRVSLLDAHAGNDQSLVSSLGELSARENVTVYSPIETRDAVQAMLSEIQGVIDAGTPCEPPRVYVLDELRPLNHACDRVELLMDKLANEGRKYQCYGVFSSQTWEARMFSQMGSAARDACVLKMAANMPREQARILFKDGEMARTVSRLRKPEMFANSMTFSGVVTVPFCSREDMAEVYAMVKGRSIDRAEVKPVDLTKPASLTALDRVNARISRGEIKQKQLAEALEIDEGFLSKILRGVKPMPERIRQKLEAL